LKFCNGREKIPLNSDIKYCILSNVNTTSVSSYKSGVSDTILLTVDEYSVKRYINNNGIIK